MGEDDVALLGGQCGQSGGVPGRKPGVVKALVPRVGGFVLGVVEVQVVEQGPPDGGAHIQMEQPGHPVGTKSHEQGVVQGGDRPVVLPAAHHPHLFGVQELPCQGEKLPLPQAPLHIAHWNQSFLPAEGHTLSAPIIHHSGEKVM